jgi:flagellar operon protein
MATDPINRNPALEPPGIAGAAPAGHLRQAPKPLNGPAFDQVLRTELERAGGVRFSGHALQRLQRRGIEVDQAMTDRLNAGVDRAAAKGSRDALVLVDGTAFVVSVANRTVITAVDPGSMKERVFTNIDSAVIS